MSHNDSILSPPRDPRELKGLSLEQLHFLAEDIRQRILSTCLRNGGHLGASMGAVELAIALHYVFESPRDAIVWDVGHQAYAHKLLTGRWEDFQTLRLPNGISGFLSREESPHDAFGAGHSSTSLSAALAMAWARGRVAESKSPAWTAAVIGDGGLTAGLAFEALENARELELGPYLIVLNDNQMSISQNAGAMPTILSGEHVRDYFGLFGFDYVGPVDGHDLPTLIGTLRGIRDGWRGKPVVVHAITQKGKGYTPAEERPAIYHGVSPVKEKTVSDVERPPQRTYSETFGDALCALAERDPKIVAITAAMSEGTGLEKFAARFPDRFFDVGIAEPHAVTFAAGLATQGFRPVVAIYSTFLQRSLDQIIHDVALQKLGVTFAIDRAGLVGADGPTHHGAFDLAYLGSVPGLWLAAPSCLADITPLLERAVQSARPWAIRYPRGSEDPAAAKLGELSPSGVRWSRLVENPRAIAVALGTAASRLLAASELVDPKRQSVSCVSTVFAKTIPLEVITLLESRPNVPALVVEDGAQRGGFGQALAAMLAENGRAAPVVAHGLPDGFVTHGTPAGLEDAVGLSAKKLAEEIRRLLEA